MSIAPRSLERIAQCYPIADMTAVEDIRRENLALLIASHGGQRALADALGKSPAQLSQWINKSPDAKTGRPRVMGSRAARSIEEALGLLPGWMDAPRATQQGALHHESQFQRPNPEILIATLDFLERAFGSLGKEFSLRSDADLFADAYEWLADDDRPIDERNLVNFAQWRERQQQGSTGGKNDARKVGGASREAPRADRRRSTG